MIVQTFMHEDYQSMPWKNGLGQTLQLACSHDTMQHFDWRISIADVNCDSQFSTFPQKNRIISLLEGNGITLQYQDRQQNIQLKKHDIYYFSGTDPIYASLVNGAIRDFNLIYQADRYHAEMQCYQQDHCHAYTANLLFVFNASAQALSLKIDEREYAVNAQQLIKIENNQQLALDVHIHHPDTTYYVIQLSAFQ